MKCKNIEKLKSYLVSSLDAKSDESLQDGVKFVLEQGTLIVNVYDTGSVLKQGTNSKSDTAKLIDQQIEWINSQE